MRTVEEVRRLRLEQVRQIHGTWTALNRALELDPRNATFTQIVSEKTKKEMGSALARRLEALVGKPVGWMDTDPDLDAQAWPFGPDISAADVAALPRELLAEARGMLKLLLAQSAGARGFAESEPSKPQSLAA